MPALIDMGAGRTVLTPIAIQAAGLSVVDHTTITRAGGTDIVAGYAASIHFPRYNLGSIEVIQVLSFELPEQPIQCLIGRDVLSRWAFTYNGRTGESSIDDEADTAVVRRAWVEPSEGAGYDVFISHATEDKAYVERLVAALKSVGIRVWYDKDMVEWGDPLRRTIDDGLLNSRFGIVVLSKALLHRKQWTEHELNGLFAKESAGQKVILPIWHGITQDDMGKYSSAFIDRFALDSQRNSIEEIVRKLQSLLRRHRTSGKAQGR